jgi:opacity protein-like surface antigen
LGLSFKKLKSSLDIYFKPTSSSAFEGFSLVYNVGAGVSYMINDYVSLDLGANYGYSNYSLENIFNTQNPFNYDSKAMTRQFNIYLSLPFYFHCTKGN